jgi:hypothetical protein
LGRSATGKKNKNKIKDVIRILLVLLCFHEELQLSKMCAYGLDDRFSILTDRFSIFFGTMSISALRSNQKVRHEAATGKTARSFPFLHKLHFTLQYVKFHFDTQNVTFGHRRKLYFYIIYNQVCVLNNVAEVRF